MNTKTLDHTKYPLLAAEMTFCGRTEDGDFEYQTDATGNVECFIGSDREKARMRAMADLARFWSEMGETNEKREARRFLKHLRQP